MNDFAVIKKNRVGGVSLTEVRQEHRQDDCKQRSEQIATHTWFSFQMFFQ
jgi:hypothetical protein